MRDSNCISRVFGRILLLLLVTSAALYYYHANFATLSLTIRQTQAIEYELDAAEQCQRHGEHNSPCIVLYTQQRHLEDRRQIHFRHQLLLQNDVGAERVPSVYLNVTRIAHTTLPVTQAESIFIALATSSHRVLEPEAILSSWLPGSRVHFLLTLPFDDSEGAEEDVRRTLGSLGLSSYHVLRDEANFYGDAWSSALPKMVELARASKTKISHYVLMDDDTMITSLVNFRHMLDEHDPEIQRVIGSPSEVIFQAGPETGGGSGGYGGAGVILTRSLAENVARNWDDAAIIRYTHKAGDCMLSGAIAYVQGRPMRSPNIYYERALHQNDISAPATSLIQGGFRWLTIHHWRWFDIYPGVEKHLQVARVAEFSRLMDSENLFQNHLLRQDADETVILTLGCCLTTYSPPLSDDDLYRLEAVSSNQQIGRFSIMNFEATHGRLRQYREEGQNKTTAWYTGLSRNIGHGESYTMLYEHSSTKEVTHVVWVVSP